MQTEITPFAFGENLVRVHLDENNEPWFVAKDVATILGYRDAYNMARMLDEDERGTRFVSTLGGMQEMVVISEPGLYAVCLRSERPEAKPFRKWVTGEVLPAIRKSGIYVMPAPERAKTLPEGTSANARLSLKAFSCARMTLTEHALLLGTLLGLEEADDFIMLFDLYANFMLDSDEGIEFCPTLPAAAQKQIWRDVSAHGGQNGWSGLRQARVFAAICAGAEEIMLRSPGRRSELRRKLREYANT